MTGKDRQYGRALGQSGPRILGQPWALALMPVDCHADCLTHHSLAKAGHAFYVVAVDNLFVRGSPFRLNYSQSSAGLP
jgi:hypothetical protein